MKDDAGKEWDLYDLTDRVRMNGWQMPSYPLPKSLDKTIVQRVVVRSDLSMQLAVLFVEDLKRAIEELNNARILISHNKDKEKGSYGFTH